ncbi:hypothetical protein [Lentilactobacillus laojiaonis]|uniref:hypothetical protein n=1 Tax=Lentilactobacillus laojiaonis TaxID=2883998 RepID=UPI001D09B977|nr:hypothetical protein [Lentilactobacillus laojiaonis]UDM32017.1 hypothetical protein LHL71_05685 [Lentilactobacillus laojiaonis]
MSDMEKVLKQYGIKDAQQLKDVLDKYQELTNSLNPEEYFEDSAEDDNMNGNNK